MMAGPAEATQVAGLGEDRELRKQNGSRIYHIGKIEENLDQPVTN
jgi:hypothetical protein